MLLDFRALLPKEWNINYVRYTERMDDHQQYTRTFFKRILPRYDLYVAPLRPLRRKIVALSEATKGTKVIDLACGTGEQSIAFARAGCSVVGVDLSEEMLQRARQKTEEGMDVEFICQDASSLPYKDASFDVATISLGLHDMPDKMAVKVLQEMSRVTKPGGKIIIVEHHTAPTLFGKVMHWIMKRFDTRYYPAFIEIGLDSFFDIAELEVEKHFTELHGILQVAVCKPKGKIKVLMTLHGMWPIHIHRKYNPIELEPGISLVCIDEEETSAKEEWDFSIKIHEKGTINIRSPFRNHPLSKLPKMGLLFEVQKRKNGSFMYMPHQYVAISMRPKTILRLFKSGEFITSLIINELGFDIYTPISNDPDLLYYEIEPQTIDPMQKFYRYLLPKFQQTDKNFHSRKGSPTFENLRLRLNNAMQFLDKSYFDEFSFQRSIGDRRKLDVPRNDNYLRHIFCWLGIESLACYGKDDKLIQLKTHIRHFLSGYTEDVISALVDTHYDRRSGYIHADPDKMHRILNRDLETVRDILKQLILVYLLICSDKQRLVELGRKGNNINPVKGLTRMDVTKYFEEMKNDAGADFESYTFWIDNGKK